VLKTLRISNYAIINEAEIQFSDKLNIITGETGAGKSILLGALSLVLGERADSKVLFNKEKKCVVEGWFDISNYGLGDFFKNEDIDYENETVIRRELSENGKSRAFINDTPVNLNTITALADKLVTIHSQHESLALGNSAFQLMVVDALASNKELLNTFRNQFSNWKASAKHLKQAEEIAAKAITEKDFIEYQFQELEKASLNSINQYELETELSQLNHAEDIKKNLITSAEAIQNGEINVIASLRSSISQLNSVAGYLPVLKDYIERLESATIELKDIANDLEAYAENTIAEPKRAEEIQSIINTLYRLLKKHSLSSVEQLIELRDSYRNKLQQFESSAETIQKLQIENSKQFAELSLTAKRLSERRVKIFSALEKAVKDLLAEVGMKDAKLKVSHEFSVDKFLNEWGADSVQFLFNANKAPAMQDIKKIASGGELSRLMLCIKSLIAKSIALPTLIFDEIDTGVSGETANKVGKILQSLSNMHQVIAISHLPQIAVRGKHHLYVYKQNERNTTQTRIKLLSNEERLQEIAKMLSGEKPSQAAILNAKELLELTLTK
jgi:DNA repair protein RecN (Recombination protein N)